MLVRIMKAWDRPNLLRQTPQGLGVWGGVTFTTAPAAVWDYVIVLNGVSEVTTVTCPPTHIWSIIQEPPTERSKLWHINPDYSFRMFTTDPTLAGGPYLQSQPALSWHVKQTYDFLLSCPHPEKTLGIPWITSNLQGLKGHRLRMRFLAHIQGKLTFDLWGRGFTPLNDKWDGWAPYAYSLAIENYSNPFYWSEKLADCYLAWCMPIYYGCTRITDYFPAESMIQIDIQQPDAALAKIKEAIASNAWQRNLEAIAHARELVLKRYQLFPFIVDQISHFESTYGAFAQKQMIIIAPRTLKEPLRSQMQIKAKQALVRLLRFVGAKI